MAYGICATLPITAFTRIKLTQHVSRLNLHSRIPPPRSTYNIFLPLTHTSYQRPFLFMLFVQNCVMNYRLYLTCHIPRKSSSLCLIALTVFSCLLHLPNLLPFRSKYSPPRPLLKHPQSAFSSKTTDQLTIHRKNKLRVYFEYFHF